MYWNNRFSRWLLGIVALVLTIIWWIGRDGESMEEKDEPVEDALSERSTGSQQERPQVGTGTAGDPQPASEVFVSGTGEGLDGDSLTPAARRAERVEINPLMLENLEQLAEGDEILVELFGEASLRATVQGNRVWGGGTRAIDAGLTDGGRLFLAETNGRVRLLIRREHPQRWYRIHFEPERDGYVLLEIDRAASAILGCGADALVTPPHSDGLLESQEPASGQAQPTGYPPDTVTVDILAVYTPAAEAVEGDATAMANNISLSMQLSNEVHGNSDTRIDLNLVHTMEGDFTEDDPETDESPSDYLNAITDGEVPGVHAARDQHEADFVFFYVDMEKTGGLAWNPASFERPELGYALARVQQTDWTYTVVHEIGHNMGLGHSITQAEQPYEGGFFPDAAGWQWADSSSGASIGYCSVMTYEDFDGDSGNGDEYERVAYFANPDILYNGNPTGDAVSGNAARLLRSGRFAYSGYRGARAEPTSLLAEFPEEVDFEGYLETWYQPDTDLADFSILDGPTPSPNTGPSGPYSGSYGIYLEATPYNPGDTALLVNRFDLESWEAARLEFRYHMYGSWMGELAVEASTDAGASWQDLWSRSGDQGNQWLPASVDLDAYSGSEVWIRLRAERGSSFQSDIALDDLVVTAQPAAGEPLYADWVASNYPGLSDPSPEADPDGDGISNFLEYAFGLQLDSPDAALAPRAVASSGSGSPLQWEFVREREGIRYIVESSGSLGDWSDAAVEWDSESEPWNLVPVGERQVVEVPVPADGRVFSRMEATESP